MRVLALGAHPDDPGSGCGGTMARYVQAGDEVLAVYLTRGGRGVPGRDPREVESMRTGEAQDACHILGVRPLFPDFADGAPEVSPPTTETVRRLLEQHTPDLLLAHWSLDTHPDHQAVGILALRAWLSLSSDSASRTFLLHFYEVPTGEGSKPW